MEQFPATKNTTFHFDLRVKSTIDKIEEWSPKSKQHQFKDNINKCRILLLLYIYFFNKLIFLLLEV